MKQSLCTIPSCRNYQRYCRIPNHTPKLSKAELEKPGSKNSLPVLTKEAQEVFNQYIRLRDKGQMCICGCKRPIEQAGHFFPMGSYSGVRFDEENVYGIATVCNYYSGSAIDPEFEAGLSIRIGVRRLNRLKERAQESKLYRWTRSELTEIIETYSNKVLEFNKKKTAA